MAPNSSARRRSKSPNYNEYALNQSDKDLLASKDIAIFEDKLIGGHIAKQVYAGSLTKDWNREVYQEMPDRNNRLVKRLKRKELLLPGHRLAIKAMMFYPKSVDEYKKIDSELLGLKNLDHPNIVAVYRVIGQLMFSGVSKVFVVTEQADETLETYLTPYRKRNSQVKLSDETGKQFVHDIITGLRVLFADGRSHGHLDMHDFLVFKTSSNSSQKLKKEQERDVVKVSPVDFVHNENRFRQQWSDLKAAEKAMFFIEMCSSGETKERIWEMRKKIIYAKPNSEPRLVCDEITNDRWFDVKRSLIDLLTRREEDD